jgi:hypothetical protein
MADGWVNVRKRKTPRGVRKVPISAILRPQDRPSAPVAA